MPWQKASVDTLVNLIQVASVVAAGGFGLLGLFTEYKDRNGKITRWGQVASGGIIVSAVLSLTSGVLEQRRKAVEDARAEAAGRATESAQREQLRRFETQNAALQRILERSEESVRQSRLTQAELSASTERTIRKIWQLSNNVEPGDIKVEGFVPVCSSSMDVSKLRTGWSATINIGDKNVNQHRDLFERLHVDWEVPRSTQLAHIVSDHGVLDGNTIRFSEFHASGDLSALQSLDQWSDKSIAIELTRDLTIENAEEVFGKSLYNVRNGSRKYQVLIPDAAPSLPSQ